jgi:hypothetical protein
MDRRACACKLIELDGLVQKSGLVAVANDDRALILGPLFLAARTLTNQDAKEKCENRRENGEEAMNTSNSSQ